MKSFIIREGFVWVVLLALSLVGFVSAGSETSGAAYVVVGLGFAKFFLILFDFMGLRRAHRGWQVGMTLFALTLFAAIASSL